jgi:hypothetical protein
MGCVTPVPQVDIVAEAAQAYLSDWGEEIALIDLATASGSPSTRPSAS